MISLKKLCITALLSLISPAHTFCMEFMTIDLLEKRNKDIKEKTNNIINNFLQNKDIATPSADIGIIESRYSLIQEKINNQYKTLCIILQQKYSIKRDLYLYFKNIEKNIAITPNDKKKTISSKTSAPVEILSSYFLSYLKKTLKKHNIDESLVIFTYNQDKRYYAKSPQFSSRIQDNHLHIQIDKPGHINISKNMITNFSLNAQKGSCIALVNQFRHLITAQLMYHMINSMTEKTIYEEEFYTLMRPNKKLSLLNLALKSPRNTHALKNLYLEDGDILLTINEYMKICKIDTLHSVFAWLKEYEQNNQKPSVKNPSAPQYTICKSCLGKRSIEDRSANYPEMCHKCRSAIFEMSRLLF